jgi:large subunit ribosomal protein L13
MKTYQPTQKEVKRNWHEVNADGKVVGRLATEVVKFLMGKHKPTYSAHMDSGDFVVVTNAEKITVTGNKKKNKVYYKHSQYPGGLREIKLSKMLDERSEWVIKMAIRRMLPDNRLRDKRLARLKILTGSKNPYSNKFKKEEK